MSVDACDFIGDVFVNQQPLCKVIGSVHVSHLNKTRFIGEIIT